MRMPVKLNRDFWPLSITRILPSADDPRVLIVYPADENKFSRAVSTFKFGSTFKSTGKLRFPLTLRELASLQFDTSPVIIDVGASDGITSLDVMETVQFKKYYVTDLNIEVFYSISGNYTFFYNSAGVCILAVTDRWIAYNDFVSAIFPFGGWAQAIFAHAPVFNEVMTSIRLITPALQEGLSNLVVEHYDVFNKWPHEKADLIIAANILNCNYFSSADLRKAVVNLFEALQRSGCLVIIDNRDIEKSTIFRLCGGKVEIEKKINNGSEIESLIMTWFNG
jgi:hypothetical protein